MIPRTMINRIKALLTAGADAGRDAPQQRAFGDLQVAAAALLVEAAEMDSSFDERERAKVLDLVRSRFELSEEEARSLIELAQERVAESSQLYGFTRVVKDQFDYDERVELMEMLWEVVYADSVLHDHEANLMRRVAGLVYVADRDSGAARKRALRKLGLEG